MTKPTVEQRLLERLDKQTEALDRLAAAIEQQAAQMARGTFGVVGTTGGVRPAGPLKHYGSDTPPEESTHEHHRQVRRVRPARG